MSNLNISTVKKTEVMISHNFNIDTIVNRIQNLISIYFPGMSFILILV